MKILITGGSGSIGGKLTELLKSKGHEVAWLTRKKDETSKIKQFEWDINKRTIEEGACSWSDVIVHLAGASIAGKRWDAEYKKILRDSRVESAELIFDRCLAEGEFPKAYISSSAIGFYGYDSGGVWKKENSRFGDDFLANLTKEWESKADLFAEKGVRTVKMRTGIVLDPDDGALPQMSAPVKWGFGAPLGSGEQYVSWVHVDDVINTYLYAVENDLNGAYNQTAPEPVTNRHLTKEIAKVLKKPLWLPPVPAFMVKMLIGGLSASVLGSVRASSDKIREEGYEFKWTNLNDALTNLLK